MHRNIILYWTWSLFIITQHCTMATVLTGVFRKMADTRILSPKIATVQDKRLLQCTSLCGRTTDCVGFQYDVTTRLCELFTYPELGSALVTSSAGRVCYVSVDVDVSAYPVTTTTAGSTTQTSTTTVMTTTTAENTQTTQPAGKLCSCNI